MKLTPLPALSDNYIWIWDDGTKAVVVDPTLDAPVSAFLNTHGLELSAILVTHHHPDHVAGVQALQDQFHCSVYAPEDERITLDCTRVGEGNVIDLLGVQAQVWHVPGHTLSHVAYCLNSNALSDGPAPILFCGDTLFSGGCGRLFEGSAAQMLESLRRFQTLPNDTKVCCAHEYTLSNLAFALCVDPDNTQLKQHKVHCEQLRAAGLPTLPSQMGIENQINPFLRIEDAHVIASVEQHTPCEPTAQARFAALREWKNTF